MEQSVQKVKYTIFYFYNKHLFYNKNIYFDKNFRMFQNNQNGKMLLLQQFQCRLKNIDQIARLAIQSKEKKITEKYSNIQSTAKILKALIIQFTKKSIKVEQQLRETARIEDLQFQTQYHKKRLEACIKLSQNLQTHIANKKSQIQRFQIESKKMKEELILSKTQNIKKILKIQMLENLETEKLQKENEQKRMKTIKQKMYQNRKLIETGLIYKASTIDLLKKQKQQLSTLLWNKISKKLQISKRLFENYDSLKQKLVKKQKKSNIYGLAGSLLFKLEQNKQLQNTIGLTIGRKNKLDHKLLIYDVLKQKHSNEIKIEKQLENQLSVDFDQFMKFTPIQILGLIQLKGGISYLRNNKVQMFEEIKSKANLNKTNYKATSKIK